MKKIIYILVFCITIFIILINSYEIMNSIKFSFSLCINNLFPSLIPFMLLSNILINYNFVNDISDMFKNIMQKIFKVNKNCSFAFIMSILSGTPSNSKYLKDLFDKKLININDCQKCLNFCHFTNPLFILGTIGYTFLNDKKLGLIILISHYTSSIFIGFFNKRDIQTCQTNIELKEKNNNFINILTSSINSTISTLLLILGIITACIIITTLVNNIFIVDDNFKFVYGFIEITQGLKYLVESNFNVHFKSIISSFLISFGGFCIHAQVFSILDNKKIRYLPYLFARIFQGILAAFFTFILVNLLY